MITLFLGAAPGILIGLACAFAVNIQNFKNRLEIERTDGTIKVGGAVFFVSINRLLKEIDNAAQASGEIILDMERVTRIDATSVERLVKKAKALARAEKKLTPLNLCERVKKRYEKQL